MTAIGKMIDDKLYAKIYEQSEVWFHGPFDSESEADGWFRDEALDLEPGSYIEVRTGKEWKEEEN